MADQVNASATTSLQRIFKNADLYILAIHDDAILAVAKQLAENGLGDKLITHTSGATPMAVFENTGLRRFGIFYPLQTFSISKKPDFKNIPFCIDANNSGDILLLKKLAKKISNNVQEIKDGQRAVIHVAAVFVNNFTNHLYSVANDILKNENIGLDILLPLIQETANKLNDGTPEEMQTGPAIRGDEITIKRHLEYLDKYPEYKEIYKLLSAQLRR